MAWRIDHLVVAGELDNTQLGWTIGWLELSNIPERLQLKLVGNCHPDLAGWKFKIKRTRPDLQGDVQDKYDGDEPPKCDFISPDQSGHVGDITADQMIKEFDLPVDEVAERLMAGEQPPFTWQKCLYLEWFSNRNGRIVVQSTRLSVERLDERAFELTEDEWRDQAKCNQRESNHFMIQLGDALKQQQEGLE